MTDILLLFLRIGILGYGGPIALVALIEQEVCAKHKWLTETEFSEIFSICKMLPGPLAVQVAIFVGYKHKGRIGGLLAGLSFILPSVIIMLGLSIIYAHNTNITNQKISYLFKFMQDATIAIIAMATWDLAKIYIRPTTTDKLLIYLPVALILVSTIVIYYIPTWEPLIIISSGILGILLTKKTLSLPVIFISKSTIMSILFGGISLSIIGQLLWICIKAGEFSFGTGLAIIPLLHGDLVSNTHWLSNKQFLDGVALGQITPGPTSVSVVFFGYQIAGIIGVIIATIGFYTPAFINTLMLLPLLWDRIIKTTYLQTFIKWAFPAIIGGIISATYKISHTAITTWYDVVLTIVVFIIIIKRILPLWAIIPLAGIIGVLINYLVTM